MQLPIEGDFREICREIHAEVMSVGERALVWSDDMYQRGPFCGGWDPEPKRFFFSFHAPDGVDYWFSVTLWEILAIAEGERVQPELERRGPYSDWP